MKRILLDTNVYGKIVEEQSFLMDLSHLVPVEFVIYGMPLIRKELRDLSSKVTLEGHSKRNMVLIAYDKFIKKENHSLKTNEFILLLAHKYFESYKKIGGAFSHDEMLSDFTIVACATLYQLDVVVSDDKRTMLSDKARQAYELINKEKQFRTPEFYLYEKFKEIIRGLSNVRSANSSE